MAQRADQAAASDATDGADGQADAQGCRVFVYGSLKRGFGNHPVLEGGGAKYLGTHVIDSGYRMFDMGGYYPGVTKAVDEPGHSITGEVYVVDEPTLQALDFLEGHPNYYERQKLVETEWKRAWIYLLRPEDVEGCESVESGDWQESE